MKQISHYIVFVGLLSFLLLYSCKDFLNQDPISEIPENRFFNTSEQVEAGIIACYDGLQQAVMHEFLLTELRSDNTTTQLGEGEAGQIDFFRESTSSGTVLQYWQNYYNVIRRTNTVIEYATEFENEDVKYQYIAEARFIRALSYFNLVRLFGEIPLIEKNISPDEYEYFEKKPVAEIYNSITGDLQFAIDHLPVTHSAEGRADSWAARSFLAKVLLTQKDFGGALSEIEMIINSGPYILLESYEDVFAEANELNDEIIFSVQFIPDDNTESQIWSAEFDVKGLLAGANIPSESLIDEFDTLDYRYDVTFKNDELRTCNKFVASSINDMQAGNDYIVMRYADILLMHAEAEMGEGASTSSTEALQSFNAVRKRAGLDTVSIITSEDLLQERQLEFAFENQRWFDLIRFDKSVEKLSDVGIDIDKEQQLYAIPDREISVSNGKLHQNPYYN